MNYYRHGPQRPSGVAIGVPRLTPMVKKIVIVSAVVWLIQHVLWRFGVDIAGHIGPFFGLGVVPEQVLRGALWQPVTYIFLHSPAGPLHILFNMLMLWMFGRDIERLMGPRRFLTYYLTCVVGAGLIQLLVGVVQGWGVPTLGASGGVFGIFLAYGMAFPDRRVMLMFPPIPMKAKYFVIMLGLFELSIGFSGVNNGIANFAHLGGMLFGFALIKYWGRKRNH